MQCSNRWQGKNGGVGTRNGAGHYETSHASPRDLTGDGQEPHPQFPVGDTHNMTVSCRWRLHECGRGVNSMMVAMLVAGIGLLLAGLAAIGFGIPVQEFSFGNTLILAGSVTACTGVMLLGLWIAVRELKNVAQRLGSGVPAAARTANPRQPAALHPDCRARALTSRAVVPVWPRRADVPDEDPGPSSTFHGVRIGAAMAGRGRGTRSRAR